jgi:ABC-type sugar transport system permease subunit
MIITATYEAFPFTYVVLLSRMMQIPATLYQVTESLGASAWKTFATVTWPHIRLVVAGVVLLRILITWPKFDIPWLVYASQAPSRWGDTLAITVYRTAFERLRTGEAYAVSVLLLSGAWALYAVWNMVRTTEEKLR